MELSSVEPTMDGERPTSWLVSFKELYVRSLSFTLSHHDLRASISFMTFDQYAGPLTPAPVNLNSYIGLGRTVTLR